MKIKIPAKVQPRTAAPTSVLDVAKARIAADPVKSGYRKNKDQSIVERLKVMDPEFGAVVTNMERHWLYNSNEVLREIIDQIRALIHDPETTMDQLVKALDKISEKAQLAQGLPTSFSASMHVGLGNVNPAGLTDPAIDSRLKQIEDHLALSKGQRQLMAK